MINKYKFNIGDRVKILLPPDPVDGIKKIAEGTIAELIDSRIADEFEKNLLLWNK